MVSDSSKNKLLFYNAIVSDECILNSIADIMNKMSMEAFSLREDLNKWDEFRILWTRDLSSHTRKQEEKNGEFQEYLALTESLASRPIFYKYTFLQNNFEDLKRELDDLLTRNLNILTSIVHRE